MIKMDLIELFFGIICSKLRVSTSAFYKTLNRTQIYIIKVYILKLYRYSFLHVVNNPISKNENIIIYAQFVTQKKLSLYTLIFIIMQEILSKIAIDQKVNRIAYQLLENCFQEDEIFIGGIKGNGSVLAKKIANIIETNSSIKVHFFEIKIHKSEPWSHPIELSQNKAKLKNRFIILVDDVLNSGKTMQYALIELLQFPTKAIKTVALVDRKHRRFPIKADFVGLSLSTTLKEHVEVVLDDNNQQAFLK